MKFSFSHLRNFLALLGLLVICLNSGCLLKGFSQKPEIVERRSFSNFTQSNNFIYFGAGYTLYRLEPLSKSLEEIYSTDRLLVEQPLVDEETVFFGGRPFTDSDGKYGEKQGFLAVDLESRKKVWKFDLGVGGYGTFGTYPVFAGDNLLVCARQHLHSLDKKTGIENWKLDNWFGRDSDGITIPYVFEDSVYFQIAEEYFVGTDSNDGHWAKVALASGKRDSVFPIAKNPGTYNDDNGNGIGRKEGGVVYGALRYNESEWPASYFGALDLESGKLLWEIPVAATRTQPVIAGDMVFTFDEKSLLALDKSNGKVKWSQLLEQITQRNIDRSRERLAWDYEHHYSRRLATDGRVVIVQGSRGIEARYVETGKLVWRYELESQEGDSDPIVFKNLVIASLAKDCSLVAFNLMTGKVDWKLKIPSCFYHVPFDD